MGLVKNNFHYYVIKELRPRIVGLLDTLVKIGRKPGGTNPIQPGSKVVFPGMGRNQTDLANAGKMNALGGFVAIFPP